MDATLYQLLNSGAMVLTASRHLAHTLRQEYAQAAQAQGLKVWATPRVLPWSTYIRMACDQQRSTGRQPLRLLSELQALALWEKIVAASDSGQSLLNPAQAARNAQRSWQHLHQYLIPLGKVAAWPGEEAQAFAAWATEFISQTGAHQWLDSARFTSWLFNTTFVPDTPLVVHGFDQHPPDMLALLKLWQQRGAQIETVQIPARAAQVQVIAVQDGDTELRSAARWARHLIENSQPTHDDATEFKVAVVVPNLSANAAQVRRRFADVFAPAHQRIDAAGSTDAFRLVATPSLSDYALVHHALLVLQLLQERADVLLVGQLLRSPYLRGEDSEAQRRAQADIKARDERRERWSCNELERLAAASQCTQLAACMQATAQYLREHRSAALPSSWTERFTQLLKLSGWAQGRTLDSAEQQTFAKFQQVLAQLSMLDEVAGKLSLSRAISTLRNACNDEQFAPEGLDQSVTLIDIDSIAGMQFDALWVMGSHAGEWPPAPEPDAFLPIELQRQYGIAAASAEGCLKLARQQLQRLVASAKQIVFSWPQQDEDAELRPSPLLAAWPSMESSSLVLSANLSVGPLLFAHRPQLESLLDHHAPALAPGEASGGSRILELQSRCPFRAQAELRLHAEPVPTVSPAVEATERGTLIHRVLTELWQQLRSSDGLKAMLDTRAELESNVRSIAQRMAQQVLPARTPHRQRLAALEVELCVQWVMALLEVEAHRLPFTVQRAEQREQFSFAGLNIHIQLDRIDVLPDGGTLLIDYKTGVANHTGDWLDRTPGRPRSPQLPLYALAHPQQLAGIAFAVLAPGKAEFRGLADTDSIAPGIADYSQLKASQQLPDIGSWDALLQHWESVLSALARQYQAGDAYVDPLKNECTYCHLSSLCRVHEVLEGIDALEEGSDE